MEKKTNPGKTGVWLIGAYGEIATTLIVGALAISKGLVGKTGLVTCLPPIDELNLVSLEQLVFGGIDIRSATLTESANLKLTHSRTISREIFEAVAPELDAINQDIVTDKNLAWNPGVLASNLPLLPDIVTKLRNQIRLFKEKHSLERVIVINLASAEAAAQATQAHDSLKEFETLINNDRKDLVSPSMCHAYSAFLEDCSHINFTPNTAASIGALGELSENKYLPYYGDDGKTGETLVKTALAPMFAQRNLRILSWESINMLGNNDGKTLENTQNREAKLKNKKEVLENILGYKPHSDVDIKYVPSLGDWKTAWNLIHFEGFLNVPMSMQFTWQGCDSILAAPLVLDMIRMAEFAGRQGESGPMRHLAGFFKNPIGVNEMALYPQFEMLLEYTLDHLNRERREKKVNPVG